MFKLTTKQKLTLFFIVVLVTGLISINVFMFYYMEARRLENEKNNFKAKNIIDLKVSTTTTTEKPICQHNTVWIGDGQCDDILNIENCNYDGGDCCLSDDKIDVSFCIECFCHITELKANQFLGWLDSFWSYPWGSGSNDQWADSIVIIGNFMTLVILLLNLSTL